MAGNFTGGCNSLSESRHSIKQYSHVTVQGACPLLQERGRGVQAPHRTVPQPDDPFTRASIPQSIMSLPNQHCSRRRCPLRRERVFLCFKHAKVSHIRDPCTAPACAALVSGRAMDTLHVHKHQPAPAASQTPSTHTQIQKVANCLIVRRTLTSTVKETQAESLSTGSSTTTQRWVSLLLICLNQTETGIFSLRGPITSTFPPDPEMET